MIILPFPPRRVWLISFWSVMSLFAGLLVGVFLSLFISFRWFGLGVIVALVLALPGLLWPQTVSIPYRAWNKLAREFARYARLWLMGVYYYIIFVAVGRAGSSLRLSRPDSSMSLWMLRETPASVTNVNRYEATTKGSLQQGWISTFLSWAVRSGNLWACGLLPFLILLRALETEEEKSSFPTNTYTLY